MINNDQRSDDAFRCASLHRRIELYRMRCFDAAHRKGHCKCIERIAHRSPSMRAILYRFRCGRYISMRSGRCGLRSDKYIMSNVCPFDGIFNFLIRPLWEFWDPLVGILSKAVLQTVRWSLSTSFLLILKNRNKDNKVLKILPTS